jgi:hypothetical protein
VGIELIAQSAEPGIARFRFGPQQPFSFAHRSLPQFDAEVQASYEENERGPHRSSEPVSPTKGRMGECCKFNHEAGNNSPGRDQTNACSSKAIHE